jgi:hypothetical protein
MASVLLPHKRQQPGRATRERSDALGYGFPKRLGALQGWKVGGGRSGATMKRGRVARRLGLPTIFPRFPARWPGLARAGPLDRWTVTCFDAIASQRREYRVLSTGACRDGSCSGAIRRAASTIPRWRCRLPWAYPRWRVGLVWAKAPQRNKKTRPGLAKPGRVLSIQSGSVPAGSCDPEDRRDLSSRLTAVRGANGNYS